MKVKAMSRRLGDFDCCEEHSSDPDGFNSFGKLMPISENLDADDESDNSDLEWEMESSESHKRTRRGSLLLNHGYQNKVKPNHRQRKTSCIELYANNNNKYRTESMYKETVELPSITRSMSLPESFESYEMKVPHGSRSAAARLRLPDIGKKGSIDSISDADFNERRSYLFLPNIMKNDTQNGTVDIQQLNKSEAKKLDLFMRNKFC